jgi:hypothetical protein
MALFKDVKKVNETVVLDDHEFISCEFQNCKMIYRGGEIPKLQHCHFVHCTWHLEEAAKRTVLFLRSVYHSGPGGKDLVEETLKHIRIR